MLCDVCNEYFHADEIESAIDANGNNVFVCRHCREESFGTCSDCGDFVHVDLIKDDLCPTCRADEEVSA